MPVQMPNDSSEDRLDMQGVHRVHVLFSGCSIITVDSGKGAEKRHLDEG